MTPTPLTQVEAESICLLREVVAETKDPATHPWSGDEDRLAAAPFRLPVQRVDRATAGRRGIAGTVASGAVKAGDPIRIQPSGRTSTIVRIAAAEGDLERAVAGQAVTLILADDTDAAPGDVISGTDDPIACADQFETTVVWLHPDPLLPGRQYLLKIGCRTATAQVTDIKHRLDADTLQHLAAKELALGAIGVCNISLDRQVPFDAYADNPATGGFVLIDRLSKCTVATGMIHFALRRSQNIHLQQVDVDKARRCALKSQRACVLWFTGLSGSGKSTIANAVDKRLAAMGRHTYLLDGDNVRHGLNKDLGFTEADRVENIRRVAEVCKLMVDAGLIVLTAFISPFTAERRMARGLVEDGEFIEIHVDTPLAVAEERDPKGLYKKARRGELKNFTGIDSPYEAPQRPDIRIDTVALAPEAAAEAIVQTLVERGVLASAG